MGKNLIYYCIGKEKDYIEMLRFSIFTLKNTNINQDILIISNDENMDIEPFGSNVDLFYINEENPKKLKTKIFNYPKIKKYEKVIYLDSDVVIHTILYRLFELIVDKEKIYVPAEHFNFDSHNLPQFGFQNYTQEDITYFKYNEIYPFNSGTFGFILSEEIQKHLLQLDSVIDNRPKDSKYVDQPAFNYYFNKNKLTNYDVFRTKDNYFFMEWNDGTVSYTENLDGIYHFYSYATSLSEKIKTMIIFYFINLK